MKQENRMSAAQRIARCGLFCALIFVFTYAAVPVGVFGIVHAGDIIIFAAAYFIGYDAIIAASVGSALADVAIAGAIIYAPATAVIKGLMAAFCAFRFKRATDNLTFRRSLLICGTSSLFMQAAYCAYTVFLVFCGAFSNDLAEAAFWLSFVYSLIQPIVCVPLGSLAVMRLKAFKEKGIL